MDEPAQGLNVKITDDELKRPLLEPPAHHPHARGVRPGLHQPAPAAGIGHRPHRDQPRPSEEDHPRPRRQSGALRAALRDHPRSAGAGRGRQRELEPYGASLPHETEPRGHRPASALLVVPGVPVAPRPRLARRRPVRRPYPLAHAPRRDPAGAAPRHHARGGRVHGRLLERRDPDLEKPGNECAKTFYQRVEAADRLYSEGGTRGSLTERGRALILLGPPPVLRYSQKRVPELGAGPAGRPPRHRDAQCHAGIMDLPPGRAGARDRGHASKRPSRSSRTSSSSS